MIWDVIVPWTRVSQGHWWCAGAVALEVLDGARRAVGGKRLRRLMRDTRGFFTEYVSLCVSLLVSVPTFARSSGEAEAGCRVHCTAVDGRRILAGRC